MRVVLDSNVFIAALLIPQGVAAELLRRWRKRQFTLLYSTELLLELRDVLARPVFVRRIKRHRVGAVIRRIRIHGQQILSNRNTISSRDPKDDFLIAIAENGEADFLVSRDIDGILVLDLTPCQAISPEDFLERLRIISLD
jgi:uncharacterized protein